MTVSVQKFLAIGSHESFQGIEQKGIRMNLSKINLKEYISGKLSRFRKGPRIIKIAKFTY